MISSCLTFLKKTQVFKFIKFKLFDYFRLNLPIPRLILPILPYYLYTENYKGIC